MWNASRGHRLAPWRSPYLRWRIETYTGLKMDKIGFFEFWGFLWRERAEESVRMLCASGRASRGKAVNQSA